MGPTIRDVTIAQWQVFQGEEQVAKQTALIQRLENRGLPTELARAILESFESALAEQRKHLEQVQRGSAFLDTRIRS